MTTFLSLGNCPQCHTPLMDDMTPGFAECPYGHYSKALPTPHPPVVGTPSLANQASQGSASVPTYLAPNAGTSAPWNGAQAVSASGQMALVSYCPDCGMPGVGPCASCGYDPMAPMPATPPYLGFAKQSTPGTPATSKPLNRRDSAVAAFAPDVRAALDTVLGPEQATGNKLPTPSRALDGMQATFEALFTTLDIAHLEDYPRDAAQLDAGGALVARLAAWGIALMAALYERSGVATEDDGEKDAAS